MNEIELKKIWDLFVSKFTVNYTYEQFKQKMSIPENVDKFYKKYGQELGLDNPQEKTVTTKYVTQYPNEPKPNRAFKSRPCDENVFPWTYGCKNNKIGQMNDIYFGDTYGNIYGNNLYVKLKSLGSFEAPGEKDGQISEKIYNMTLEDSLQENQQISRKKIVKEAVKNILKERLNKN